MTTNDVVPLGARASPTRRRQTLDRTRPLDDDVHVTRRELLQKQDWASITAKVAKFAHKHLFPSLRSMERANDLAQEAVFKTFEHPETWDPEKEHIVKHVCKKAMGIMSNERALQRNTFEVMLGDDHPRLLRVQDENAESPEEALDRKQMADRFRKELTAALQGKELASDVLAMMIAGQSSPSDQKAASSYDKPQLCAGRRVLFYHADQVAAELARELDEAESEEEVAQ